MRQITIEELKYAANDILHNHKTSAVMVTISAIAFREFLLKGNPGYLLIPILFRSARVYSKKILKSKKKPDKNDNVHDFLGIISGFGVVGIGHAFISSVAYLGLPLDILYESLRILSNNSNNIELTNSK